MRGSLEAGQIAVVIPCFHEELTIGKVIDDFRRELPNAAIFGIDNCSTDRSAAMAAEHGATVLREPRQGKGFVVDSMLANVDAEAYVRWTGTIPTRPSRCTRFSDRCSKARRHVRRRAAGDVFRWFLPPASSVR